MKMLISKARKEFRRVLNLKAFTVEGYSLRRDNQYGTRYYFDDSSVLRINDKQMTIEVGIMENIMADEPTWLHVCSLAWHPNRNVNGKFLELPTD